MGKIVKVVKAGVPKKAPAAAKPKQAPAASGTRLPPIPEESAEKVELRFTRSKAATKSGGRPLPGSDSDTLESDAIEGSPPAVYGRKRGLGSAPTAHPKSSGIKDVFMDLPGTDSDPADTGCSSAEDEADSASLLMSRKVKSSPLKSPPTDPGPVFPCPTYVSDSFGVDGAWVRARWNANAWDGSCKRGKAYTTANPEFGSNILRTMDLMKQLRSKH